MRAVGHEVAPHFGRKHQLALAFNCHVYGVVDDVVEHVHLVRVVTEEGSLRAHGNPPFFGGSGGGLVAFVICCLRRCS